MAASCWEAISLPSPGENRFYLARLLANGTLDPLFQPEANDPVSSLAVQADGRIVVGGSFSRLTGANLRSLGRLTPGGQADPTWTGCGLEDKVNALAVSGSFLFAAGPFRQPHMAVVKLLSNPPAQAPIATASALPDIHGVPGQPLLLTVPLASSADTTYTWNHPHLAPLLTTAPELFFPNAPPELAGTWSVTAVNDTGSLTWQPLHVRLNPASPGLPPVRSFTTTPLPVTLPTLGTILLPFPAPAMVVGDLRVHLNLQHSDVNDLMIDLIAPDGQRLSLTGASSSRRGSNFEHTTFADDAPFTISAGAAPFRGTWQPDQAGGFSSLRRSHAAGVWHLSIEDTDADSSAATVQWASLEFSLPATLPGFTTALPPNSAAFQLTPSTAILLHWNAPPGLTSNTETSSDLLQWQPATVLAIRQEADQSQRRTLARPAIPACYFRSTAR